METNYGIYMCHMLVIASAGRNDIITTPGHDVIMHWFDVIITALTKCVPLLVWIYAA